MAFETISLGTQPAGTGGDTARTAFEKVNRNFIAADVLAAAMSQAQFDAIREQNKERYAASGWVSFGNHESGKQVNECKPGLYTALTTPNTLLIGKAGGVGGSKTDYASVNIDGVVFNLTNQFVLTLPSHPTSVLPERMDMYGVETEKVEINAASPNAYQGGLRGVGAAVNLFTATDQQKKDFFAQNSNTTYIGTDGKIYQWQLYAISFSGTTDGVPSPSEQGYSLNSFGDLWLKAGKNLLYFGNALRLNDGGYHHSFNPLGTAKFVGDTFWYNTATSITSKADCFNPAKLLAGSGSIASGKSGRPEIGGRYYDAIYTDGFGGVCRDMRYSAYGIDVTNYIQADQRVKNGDYRGFDKLMFTRVLEANDSAYNVWLTFTDPSSKAFLASKRTELIGTSFYIQEPSGTYASRKIVAISETGNMITMDKTIAHFVGAAKVVVACPIDTSIGGAFLQTDVIGNPVNIFATDALNKGWYGNWISQVPNGVLDEFFLSKQCIVAGAVAVTYTTNNGANWGITGAAQNVSSTAIIYTNLSANQINILTYVASANQTEQVNNAPTFSGLHGVGAVWVSNDNTPEYGSLFMQSLIGKVGTNRTVSPTGIYALPMMQYQIDGITGLFYKNSNYTNQHAPITNLGFFANSPAVKALNYNVNINQQAVIQYAYTELKHNGTDWGDDGKLTIVDNQATKTDLNGNTVLVGTAKLKEPIGWIKNKV